MVTSGGRAARRAVSRELRPLAGLFRSDPEPGIVHLDRHGSRQCINFATDDALNAGTGSPIILACSVSGRVKES